MARGIDAPSQIIICPADSLTEGKPVNIAKNDKEAVGVHVLPRRIVEFSTECRPRI